MMQAPLECTSSVSWFVNCSRRGERFWTVWELPARKHLRKSASPNGGRMTIDEPPPHPPPLSSKGGEGRVGGGGVHVGSGLFHVAESIRAKALHLPSPRPLWAIGAGLRGCQESSVATRKPPRDGASRRFSLASSSSQASRAATSALRRLRRKSEPITRRWISGPGTS